jgi:hypothetical protein
MTVMLGCTTWRNPEDDTSEGSKKKKEPVFIHGVELVDLDECNVPDRRMQCDNKDTNNKKAPNREEMDVDDGAPLSMQTLGPSSSIASALVSAVVLVQIDPLVESSHGFSDPLFNAIGKAPHSDAVTVK